MNSSSLLKFSFLVVIVFIFLISNGKCQDEDEDDEDTYDEELGDESSTTTRRPRRRTSTSTVKSETAVGSSGTLTNDNSTVRSTGAEASTRRVSVPTPASPVSRTTLRTTTPYDYEDDEPTTTEDEEGYAYIFRPLNNLVENIVQGNVTGIVDNALSIRTPPEIRAFVNNVMSNVFGANIGSALKQFMPHFFSTAPTPTVSSNTRDPIPTRAPRPGIVTSRTVDVVKEPVKTQAVLTARTNATEDAKSTKTKIQQVVQKTKSQVPVQIAFAPPGAPASRLRCEVIS